MGMVYKVTGLRDLAAVNVRAILRSKRHVAQAIGAVRPVGETDQMQALVARQVGSSFRDVAHVTHVAIPELNEGEVLVRVLYAGVNGGCETFRSRGEHA